MKFERKLHKRTKVFKAILTVTLCATGILLSSVQVSAKEMKKDVSSIAAENSLDNYGSDSEWSEHTFYFDNKNSQDKRIQASNVFFVKPYMIQISWNLGTKEWANKYKWMEDFSEKWLLETYKTKKDIQLEDKSTITVSFTEQCKDMAKEKNFDQVLLNAFKKMKEHSLYKDFPLTHPLIVKVQKIAETDYSKLAEELYKKQDLNYLTALYPELDDVTKESLLNKCFDDNNKKIFSRIVYYIKQEQVNKLLVKAYKEEKTSFFENLLYQAEESQAIYYAKQAYKDKNVKLFTCSMYCLNDDLIAAYAKKAFTEKQPDFFSVTMDALSCEELEEYARISFQNKELSFFTLLIDYIDQDQVGKYLKQSYKDENLKFYKELIDYADDEQIISCAKQAYNDKKIKFFDIVMDYMECDLLEEYAQISYKDGELSYFTKLLDYIDCDQAEDLFKQSYKDGKVNFFRALLDYVDDDLIESYLVKAQKQKKTSFIRVLKDY